MSLSKDQINILLRLLERTKETEINCDNCLSLVSEFIEHDLAGKSIPDGLNAVKHHLSICADCEEEYDALRQALEGLDDGNDEL
jgi:hypothetical protein